MPEEKMSEEKLPEEKSYIPLSERLNQDVWHDNFVPKYSAIPAARPSRLVLIGVWLIFAPAALFSLAFWLADVQQWPDPATMIFSTIGSLFMFTVSIVILFQQTRRYLHAKQHPESSDDEAEDD